MLQKPIAGEILLNKTRFRIIFRLENHEIFKNSCNYQKNNH